MLNNESVLKELQAWKWLAVGRGMLLIAYRLQKQPSDKAFELIEKALKILGPEDEALLATVACKLKE